MKSRAMIAAAMLFVSTVLGAQEAPAPAARGGFTEYLATCLGAGDAGVDRCAVEYATLSREGLSDVFASGADDSTSYSVIKGKYNTCFLYPDTELKGDEKGYECVDNVTGKCVSGDCCSLFDGC